MLYLCKPGYIYNKLCNFVVLHSLCVIVCVVCCAVFIIWLCYTYDVYQCTYVMLHAMSHCGN